MPSMLAANNDPFIDDSSATETDSSVTQEETPVEDEVVEASNDEGNGTIAGMTAAKKKFTGEVSTYALSWFVASNVDLSNRCGLMKKLTVFWDHQLSFLATVIMMLISCLRIKPLLVI